MAEKHLGPRFDVHGGGLDLRLPHHENEIAQSRGAGREFARLWTPNGMLELRAEKMSKSVGNVVSLRASLESWGREAILVFLLSAHCRNPIEYSDTAMEAAQAPAAEFRAAARVAEARASAFTWDSFRAALDDDFDTPRALSILHDWRAAGQVDLLGRGLGVFGLAIDADGAEAPPDLHRLAEARQAAHQRRDFGEADRLRIEIDRLGWDVHDVAGGAFRLVRKTR
jgi:cysteinyl-tRNA synthetase